MLYRVRNSYVVHLPGGKALKEGEEFEPSPAVLEGQSWKIEPVIDPIKEEAPESLPETRDVKAPPLDRAIKKPPGRK